MAQQPLNTVEPFATQALTDSPTLLLPVRLEVRRVETEILIRVYPDHPFIDSHQQRLTAKERADGRRLSELVRAADWPATLEETQNEWKELARRYGPPRAAWIVEKTNFHSFDGDADSANEKVPELFLMPTHFHFLAFKGETLAYHGKSNPVLPGRTILPAPVSPVAISPTSSPPPPADGIFDDASKWVTDFAAAEEAGLAMRFKLEGNDVTDTNLTFSQIVVVGLRGGGPQEGITAVRQFVTAHRFTDGIEFLPYSSPTNNTGEAASAHSQSEELLLASFDHEVLRPLGRLSDVRNAQTVGAQFSHALGLDADTRAALDHIKGVDRVGDSEFTSIFDTLWPATGDYYFANVLNLASELQGRGMLHEFAREYLRPRGHLSALRVGNQPYAIIPVTRTKEFTKENPTGWKDSLNDNRLGNRKAAEWTMFDRTLFRVLDTLHKEWKLKATETAAIPTAGDGPDPDAEILGILGMAPRSQEYRERPIVDSPFVIQTINFLADALMGPSSSFSGLGTPAQAKSAWVAEKIALTAHTQQLLDGMGANTATHNPYVLSAFSWGHSKPLTMSLVRHHSNPTDGPEAYLPLLEAGVALNASASQTLLYDIIRRSLQLAANQPTAVPQIGPAVAVLSAFPILEYFNETLDPGQLASLLSGGPALSVQDVVTAVETARRSLPNERYATTSEIETTFATIDVTDGPTAYGIVTTRLRAAFDKRLEATLRDVIDALTYRLDAWYSALPARRLDLMRERNPVGVHWGAFGYLEEIEFPPATTSRGKPVDGGGYIHAPSVAQATAASMLRSAFDSHRADGSNAYALNLTSTRVRQSLTLIDGIQQGQELPVLLGYQFERRLHDEGLDRIIDDFRTKFPYSEADDADIAEPTEIVAPRNVVDGRLLAETYDETLGLSQFGVPAITNLSPATDASKLVALLRELKSAVDAVSDLLLYEGIFQAAQGNYERSGAALDACAGTGRPPEIESVATQARGRTLRHRVAIFLPCLIAPTGTANSARSEAEPRFDAWCASIVGELIDIGGTAYAPPESTTPIRFTLHELEHVATVDFIEMCSALPDGRGDTEIEIRIRRMLRMRESIPENQAIRINFSESSKPRSVADAMELGRALLDMLGDATLMSPTSMFHPDEAPTQAPPTEPLSTLYENVATFRIRAEESRDTLEEQKANLVSTSAGTVRTALDVCTQYGIKEALVESENDTAILARGLAVLDIVTKRVDQANQLISAGSADDDTSVPYLTSAFKALFGEGFLAFTPFNLTTFGDTAAYAASSVLDPPSPPRTWLWFQQVAETHPRVRKLETLLMMVEAWWRPGVNSDFKQLKVAQLPFRPEFGWQALTNPELDNAERALGCLSMVSMIPEPFDVNCVSGFVVDEWTETMPAPHVTTGISFEYNQPASQAPQCFLLATPGNFDVRVWTPQHLAEIVRDTMTLARTRLVDLDSYPRVGGFLPALMFPISYTAPIHAFPPGSIPFPSDGPARAFDDRSVDTLAQIADAISHAR